MANLFNVKLNLIVNLLRYLVRMKLVNLLFKHLFTLFCSDFLLKKSKEPRLEPRLGNQYGGKLSLIFDDGIEAEVERIKGSAHGDVKIYLKDGTIRDEVWLNKKLNYISKKTYQGIFSFDVLGLQDIHKNLDEEQLQDYLLEAGALGSTEFTSMRDRIGQKKEELYKKSGKKSNY